MVTEPAPRTFSKRFFSTWSAQLVSSTADILTLPALGKTAIDYLRFSEDRQSQQIVALYDKLNATERKAVTIDYLIMAAGADPAHLWGRINEELYRVRGMVGGLLACEAAPDVTRKVIEHALRPDGYQDRRLILETVGVASVLGQSVNSRHRVKARR